MGDSAAIVPSPGTPAGLAPASRLARAVLLLAILAFELEVVLRLLFWGFSLVEGFTGAVTGRAIYSEGTWEDANFNGALACSGLFILAVLVVLGGRRLGIRLHFAGATPAEKLTWPERHPWFFLLMLSFAADFGVVEIGGLAPDSLAWPDTAALLGSLEVVTLVLLGIGLRLGYRIPLAIYRYGRASVPRARFVSATLVLLSVSGWEVAGELSERGVTTVDAPASIRDGLMQLAALLPPAGGGGAALGGGNGTGGAPGSCVPRCLSSTLGDPCKNERQRGQGRFSAEADADGAVRDTAVAICVALCRKPTVDQADPCGVATQPGCGDCSAYLARALTNAAIQAGDRRRSHAWWEQTTPPACPIRGADDELADDEIVAIAQEEIAGLEERDRELIRFRAEGLGFKEIAERLGIEKENTAGRAATRAWAKLLERMKNRCPDLDLPDP